MEIRLLCSSITKVKTCKRWQAAHLHRRETFETFYILLHWGDLFQGILQFKIWTMISLLYSGPRYGSVQFLFSKGKLCKLSRTFKIYNRQFVQFARIPVEFVARLWDMSTQKYNIFSIKTMLVKLTFLQKTNMEGDSEDATSQSLLNIEAETSQNTINWSVEETKIAATTRTMGWQATNNLHHKNH